MADDVNRDGEGNEPTQASSATGADDLFLFGEQEARRPKRDEAEADLTDLEGARAADDVTNPNIHMGIERADTFSTDAEQGASDFVSSEQVNGVATADTNEDNDRATARNVQPTRSEGGLTAPGNGVDAGNSTNGYTTTGQAGTPLPETLVEERPDLARVDAGEVGVSFDQVDLASRSSTGPVAAGDGAGVSTAAQSEENINLAPESIELSNLSFDENAPGAVIGNLSAYDPNGSGGLSFTVDDARFEIVDGQLKLRPGVSFNHEVNPQVAVTITVTDEAGLSFEQSFTLTVGDVNEGPTDISLSNASVAENAAGAVVGTLSTTDVDAGDTHT
ncbi:MAG: cadherin repeat domain-containing protein, partial [Alphaproteobacteria bacterium]|nr:cadherin repeat domain-containing protein [Alphaproteobacteria bacterium]MBO6626781.1 cadherin repeat domain-containing protein [Alphaproteobacteria bacterium]